MHVVPNQSPHPVAPRARGALRVEQPRAALLRRAQVEGQTGLGRSMLYLRIRQGLMTKPVTLGGRAVAWPAHEVEAVCAAWIAGKSADDVRALVQRLHAARAVESEGAAE